MSYIFFSKKVCFRYCIFKKKDYLCLNKMKQYKKLTVMKTHTDHLESLIGVIVITICILLTCIIESL